MVPRSKVPLALVAIALGPGSILLYLAIITILCHGDIDGPSIMAASLNITVAINLASSYGTTALRYPNGSFVVTRTEGSKAYRDVMARLSLASSQHYAPPYERGGAIADAPRQSLRGLLKRLGLPASWDVRNIGNQIRAVVEDVEEKTNLCVTDVFIVVPHLLALYQEDIRDAVEWTGLNFLEMKHYFLPLFLETPAAFAGYGFGLCEHFESIGDCAEDLKNATQINLFTVHYSGAALTTASTPQISAFGVFEPDYRHHENFSLGYAARGNMGTAESYWRAVYDELNMIVRVFGDLDMVLLTGDATGVPEFRRELQRAIAAEKPPVFSNDSVFAVAKGAAEVFARQQNWV